MTKRKDRSRSRIRRLPSGDVLLATCASAAWCLSLSGLALAQEDPCPDARALAYFSLDAAPSASSLREGIPPLAGDDVPTRVISTSESIDLYGKLSLDLSGVVGWNTSFDVRGAEILGLTHDGTLAAEASADPPGLRHEGFAQIREFGERDGFEQGITSVVVLSFSHPVTLPPEGTFSVLHMTLFGKLGSSARILFIEDVFERRFRAPDGRAGAAPWGGTTVSRADGSIVSVCPLSLAVEFENRPVFLRCDPNLDGRLHVADAVFVLNDLFGQLDAPCDAATDCNGDGRRDISDAVFALVHLFAEGPPPPTPYPECAASRSPFACPRRSTACPE